MNTDELTKDDELPIGRFRGTLISTMLKNVDTTIRLKKTIDTFKLKVSDEILKEIENKIKK